MHNTWNRTTCTEEGLKYKVETTYFTLDVSDFGDRYNIGFLNSDNQMTTSQTSLVESKGAAIFFPRGAMNIQKYLGNVFVTLTLDNQNFYEFLSNKHSAPTPTGMASKLKRLFHCSNFSACYTPINHL